MDQLPTRNRGFHGGQLFTADVSVLSDVSHGLEPA